MYPYESCIRLFVNCTGKRNCLIRHETYFAIGNDVLRITLTSTRLHNAFMCLYYNNVILSVQLFNMFSCFLFVFRSIENTGDVPDDVAFGLGPIFTNGSKTS